MPNDYFQFKNFKVQQDATAMKVTTDACLFGAWVAENGRHLFPVSSPLKVLDLGTGTGLLALMIAQKIEAEIDAIEIDKAAAKQAAENIAATSWHHRLNVIVADARTHLFAKTYDLVVSNPPFYEKDLKSPELAVNHARHDTALTLAELAFIVSRLLADEGYFAVLLPYHRYEYFNKKAATQQLIPVKCVFIKPTPKHQYNRAIVLYKKSTGETDVITPVCEELIIKEVHHSYSLPFINYLQDYYLSL